MYRVTRTLATLGSRIIPSKVLAVVLEKIVHLLPLVCPQISLGLGMMVVPLVTCALLESGAQGIPSLVPTAEVETAAHKDQQMTLIRVLLVVFNHQLTTPVTSAPRARLVMQVGLRCV